MIFANTHLAGSYLITPEPYSDERGWFARYYCENDFKAAGLTQKWVQMNHSFTAAKGSIRGLHFQVPPFREIKMVRCISGAVYDVIIDIRKGSSTFLQSYNIELSAANKKMLYIPEGFAHGFQALTDDCELLYHHSEFYTPGAEGGIRFDDPAVHIQWPLPITIISIRDANHPYLDNQFKGI